MPFIRLRLSQTLPGLKCQGRRFLISSESKSTSTNQCCFNSDTALFINWKSMSSSVAAPISSDNPKSQSKKSAPIISESAPIFYETALNVVDFSWAQKDLKFFPFFENVSWKSDFGFRLLTYRFHHWDFLLCFKSLYIEYLLYIWKTNRCLEQMRAESALNTLLLKVSKNNADKRWFRANCLLHTADLRSCFAPTLSLP